MATRNNTTTLQQEQTKDKQYPPRTRNVLSVQSHVVHGYVGNKAATFPLQFRGWNVDTVNTVEYSNHPGYGSFAGYKSSSDTITTIIEKGLLSGLEIAYDSILIGYMSNIETLTKVSTIIGSYCKKNKNVRWIIDPVLGDEGKLYVPSETVNEYKNILKHNNIFLTTPNQFEMELLTGVQIDSLETLRLSFKKFHELYPNVKNIVITSIEISETKETGTMLSACSITEEIETINCFTVPKINAKFNGSGDLFTALLMDSLIPNGINDTSVPNLAASLSKVLYLMDKILRKTYQLSVPSETSMQMEHNIINIKDLKLIESRDILALGNIDDHLPKSYLI
ncbi:hypothetical protein TBLA_0I02370 [Henningerozyma blattae CBS 6284]|uniref:pyridoxal kinase n=1 Tax=Henningerozyma blattae (strain ATCC 34711 / CBS 6284 / DSM 70876 / NBRC 10599 / NRRL Y-10934 / UCD 77-7) TaxID=1071380 RepID=I2H943_HENB6|nr:hypothetical protein TBLA_0I02370 [Tetrapisispora blattae CBS 6284]CCH62895.1 hypothetical protein TBLA_0I02370 [Tetrapisispora blattae CBS 6284]